MVAVVAARGYTASTEYYLVLAAWLVLDSVEQKNMSHTLMTGSGVENISLQSSMAMESAAGFGMIRVNEVTL